MPAAAGAVAGSQDGVLTAPSASAPPGEPAVGSGTLGAAATVRLRIDLAYEGTDFHGWAEQSGLRTVEGTLSAALGLTLRTAPPVLTVAGRTDAGVHARGQVVHADLSEAVWIPVAPAALRRLAAALPADIRVHRIGTAADGFDARFSALWRRYSYRVCDDPVLADPLRRRDTLAHPRPLDVERMNEAAAVCLGEHDFAAFCRRRPGASTIRELIRLDWRRTETGVVTGTVIADAFCHNMVRALAGAMLAIGDGRKPPGWLASVLAARVRDPAVIVAPPHALCLEEVAYPPDAELAARAAATRRVRGPFAESPGAASRQPPGGEEGLP